MAHDIERIKSIGEVPGRILRSVGIRTTEDLLLRCASQLGRRSVSEITGVPEVYLLEWVRVADLMRISGIGTQHAELLQAEGVDSVHELSQRTASSLTWKISNRIRRMGRGMLPPTLATVGAWIDASKQIEPYVT